MTKRFAPADSSKNLTAKNIYSFYGSDFISYSSFQPVHSISTSWARASRQALLAPGNRKFRHSSS